MKQLLIFILVLSLNISFAQDTLPFKKRFYLELGFDAGFFQADVETHYGPGASFDHGSGRGPYIAGSVGGFYKHRWMKLGVFYQGGWTRSEVFQHSVNVGGGFNTLGGLKKSTIWLGPFISIGGVVPIDYTSYIESYRLDAGLDLYIRNFHIGYRHSWWNDGAPSKSIRNVGIDYLEFGYAIPLRRRENHKERHQKTWYSSDTLPKKERFFIEFDGLYGVRKSPYYEDLKDYGLSIAIMYRDRFLKLALNHENIRLLQNSLIGEAGFNTLFKIKSRKWWLGPVLSGGSTLFDRKMSMSVPRLGGGIDLYFKNFHAGYRHIWILENGLTDQANYIEVGYALRLGKR